MVLQKYAGILAILSFVSIQSFGQSYDSYFIGNPTDLLTSPYGGVCMMGGASESDEASRWFLEQANGGDILVLRASGSDGYNEYFYTDLGVSVNSVETIVFNDESAADELYIQAKIDQAEGIWFAGGNQWDYVDYWRNTAIDSLINQGIHNRKIVIGGTSAGMAILGEYYFSAENGTVTSATSLNNPYHENVTVDSAAFLNVPYLKNVITDTHYDDPDRKGRHSAFIARILTDYTVNGLGIACDEYTAVCIDSAGLARAYGGFPDYEDNAYFIQTNCELENRTPEICEELMPLTWNKEEKALRVYQVKGTAEGTQWFDLTSWQEGGGGDWLFWSVEAGVFTEQVGIAPDCTNLSEIAKEQKLVLTVYPNPFSTSFQIESAQIVSKITVFDLEGRIIPCESNQNSVEISSPIAPGVYVLKYELADGSIEMLRILKE